MKNGEKKEMISFEMVFAFWLQGLNAKHRTYNQYFDATAGIDYVGYFHNEFSLDEVRLIPTYYDEEEQYFQGNYQLDDIFKINIQAIYGYKVDVFYGNSCIFSFHLDEGEICNPSIKGKKIIEIFQKWIDDGGIGEKFMDMVYSSSMISEDEYQRLLRNRINHPDKRLSANHDSIELTDGRFVEMYEVDICGMVGESITILKFMDKDANDVEGVWDLLYDTDKKVISKLQERLNRDNEANAISMVI